MVNNDPIIIAPHFSDFIDTPHLFGDLDRLPGRNGEPGKGLKVSEAVPLAEVWWETKARFSMPDYGKPPEKLVVKSGIMRGLPWFNLDKQEKLRILAQWYANVAVHTIIEGKSSSQDGEAKNLDGIREQAREILPILDTDCTHKRTAIGDNDTLERETWREGYEEIKREDALVDAQGEKLKPKEETDGSKGTL